MKSEFPPHAAPGSAPAGPARFAILLACLWLGLGATFKLISATPMDIPPVVRGFTQDVLGLGAAATYRSAIAIELSIVATALLQPRAGWLLLAAQYAVFLVVLGTQMASGATSCGCFGGTVTLAPWQMAAIDLPLLAFLVLSRPDRRLPRGSVGSPPRLGLLALCCALATWAPFHFFKTAGGPPPVPPGPAPEQVADAGPTSSGTAARGNDPEGAEQEDEGAVGTVDGESATATPEVPTQEPETVPALDLPDFVELDPGSWAGQTPDALDLFAWSQGGADNGFLLPPPCHVVVYRRSCDVCARHLETLALEGLPDGRPIVLVRVPEVDESVASAVEMLPTAALEVELHHLSKGYGVTTPWSFDVSAEFLVENVTDLGEH